MDVEALHVTLCFLGWCEASQVEEIAGLVDETAAPVDGLSLGAPVWLPMRRPRVLAVELHDETEALRELQGALSDALIAGIGWEPERRRFRPHVTVARMRPGTVGARELPPTPQLSFAAESLTLYRSELHPSGAEYEPVKRIPLAHA
jgi:2'-5' RNA ligase